MLIFLVIMLGFICPAFVSADDYFLNIFGFLLFLSVPPAVGWFGWHTWTHFKQTEEVKDGGRMGNSGNKR